MSQAPQSAPARAALRGAIALFAALTLSACATPQRLSAPAADTARAQPAVANARFLVTDRDAIMAEARRSIERRRAWLASTGHVGPPPPVHFLAISGGGDHGAFGAGVLVGWSQRGDRPEFDVVTGISTGALTAPFAFLGSTYDPQLQAVYTTVSQRDIFRRRSFLAALFDDAMADSTPLKRTLERYVTPELLQAIAAQYTRGRLLMIGTTDLDTRQPIVWNMTAIAASGDPDALELFRRILLASASIPAAFPPVMLDVEVGGRRYQEMHVDGGVTTQVFVYPPSVRLQDLRSDPPPRRVLYVIRNARLDPGWASVDRRTLSIAQRAVSTLIQTQGDGDLYRIFLTSQRDGVEFNLAYIPPDFQHPRREDFDTAYMRALFERGRQMALSGYPWEQRPPGFAPEGP